MLPADWMDRDDGAEAEISRSVVTEEGLAWLVIAQSPLQSLQALLVLLLCCCWSVVVVEVTTVVDLVLLLLLRPPLLPVLWLLSAWSATTRVQSLLCSHRHD